MTETATRHSRLGDLRLYVVTAAEDPPSRVLDTVRAAVDGGAGAVQVRRKDDDALTLLRLVETAREICAPAGVLLVVDDRLDVAMAAGADAVHLGQSDLPVEAVRRLWPEGLVGRSTHSRQQALQAQAEGADYLGVGPVYVTPTKPGRPAVGLDLVREVAPLLSVPWVAIGGVDEASCGEVLAAGAPGIAVVRAVSDAADRRAAVSRLRALVDSAAAAGMAR